jgi:hypothetical protein
VDADPREPVSNQEIDTLPDAELIARCVAPVTALMHRARPSGQPTPVRRMSPGEGAIFGFWLIESRSRGGLAEFCRFSAHRLDDSDFWTLLEGGRRHTGDAPLLSLLEALRVEWSATAGRPRAKELRRLDNRHRRLRAGSEARMAAYIREHPAEFAALN